MLALALLSSLAFGSSIGTCPIAADQALPQLTGSWLVTTVALRDNGVRDSTQGTAIIIAELEDCLLVERYTRAGSDQPFEMLALWGVNGRNGGLQRVLTHSRHGALGLYEGGPTGHGFDLRLTDTGDSYLAVRHLVTLISSDRFTIASQSSTDDGSSWRLLTLWDYHRMPR